MGKNQLKEFVNTEIAVFNSPTLFVIERILM